MVGSFNLGKLARSGSEQGKSKMTRDRLASALALEPPELPM